MTTLKTAIGNGATVEMTKEQGNGNTFNENLSRVS
jgi:hypothetical protein